MHFDLFLQPLLSVVIWLSGTYSAAYTQVNSKPATVKWAIEKTSTLRISGKSNINNFGCAIDGYYRKDTISSENTGRGYPVTLQGSLEIDIDKFDCHNHLITRDFRKTLQAETYPQLCIRFLSLEQLPDFRNTTQSLKGWVEIDLAGTKKIVQITYEYIKSGASTFQLNGSQVFCFSDFQLSPPRKLGGVIKIENEFTVDFLLKLTAVK